jgi:nucleotide-binding universal stress UspA family protein
VIVQAAAQADVEVDTVTVTDTRPYEAIISAATERHCDLIVMASDGRGGMRGLLLGSESQKVLINSFIPVLVVRQQMPATAGDTDGKHSSSQAPIIA